MSLKFNINREKISDDEIKKHQDFDSLVKQFKEQSLKKARGDESWWKNKKIQYATIIAGVTVICTITYQSLTKQQAQPQKHETTSTLSSTKTSTASNKPFILAPSPKLRVPYSTYRVNAAKGGTITHPSKTKVHIPQNSFVNKAGDAISGEVTIEYREFHDVGDIVLSGIPMRYDSAGTAYQFESAGMFDIKGSQNGEPVFIKPGKKIEVDLASLSAEQKFNQYYLDTLAQNWQYLKKDQAQILPLENVTNAASTSAASPKMLALKQQIEKVIPRQIDSVKTVCQTKITRLPMVREPLKPSRPNPSRPNFKIDGSYADYPELAAFDNVLFEVGAENRNYSKELHDITWSDLKISQGPDKGKNYILTLIYRNRSEKLIVYPVLTGVDLEKAQKMYQDKFEEYTEKSEQRKADEARLIREMEQKEAALLESQRQKQKELDNERIRLMNQSKMMEARNLADEFGSLSNSVRARRIFEVSQFGIYNSDCPHPQLAGQSIKPVFMFNNKPVLPGQSFLIDYDTKSVMGLNAEKGFEFVCKPGNRYALCVFRGQELYLCKATDLENSLANHQNTFALSALPKGSDNLQDFKTFLEL